jgi:hypothetical protein
VKASMMKYQEEGIPDFTHFGEEMNLINLKIIVEEKLGLILIQKRGKLEIFHEKKLSNKDYPNIDFIIECTKIKNESTHLKSIVILGQLLSNKDCS